MLIRVLDKETVSQIAAGEVVERPASVVKELVENALDAGSSQIGVEVRGGGVSLIGVSDNGSGIPAEEVELAFERHATSKIGSSGDLPVIRSLGFRGEALPSIAAVAQVEIVTCPVGESVGIYLSLESGVVVNRRDQGRSSGTTVTVRNLFRRVPARLKFLKATTTENGHIANVVSQYALAFPEVGFSLLVDGRRVLKTPGRGRLLDSIIEVYGIEVAQHMLEIKGSEWTDEATSLKVTGLAGSPAVSRASRYGLSFFINRRWVNSRLLARAVTEAYHGLLMAKKHPMAVIAISLPLEEVDVNIHPTKSEVKFQNERRVFVVVQKIIRETLMAQMPAPKIEEAVATYLSPVDQGQLSWVPAAVRRHRADALPEIPGVLTASLAVMRVLGQLLGSYIVAEGPDGLYLIDQHAAHERIVFEQVKQQRAQRQVEIQGLLEPVTFEVSPKQETVLSAHYRELTEFGFAVESFGRRIYLIRTVPHLISNGDWQGVLRELLDSLSGDGEGDREEKIAIVIACHSGAVRAGQVLTGDEMRELVRQLEQTSNPHTCPHGRPTMIHISNLQLRREFGRS